MKKITIFICFMLAVFISKSQNLANFTFSPYVDQEISCKGNHDGYIQCVVDEPGTYTYTIKKGTFTDTNTSGTFIGLYPGTYVVKAKNIMGVTKTATLKMPEPKKLAIKFVVEKWPTPADSLGAMSIVVTGGTNILQPYLCTWKKNGVTINDLLTDNFATYMENLTPGKYFVTVEDDRGCFFTKSYTLRRKLN